MGIQCLWLIWIMIIIIGMVLQASVSTANSDSHLNDEGCSLVGIHLQQCFVPTTTTTTTTPFSMESCCISLNHTLEAGHHCLCALLGPSNYPLFTAHLELSFSTCHITMPSLMHCHEQEAEVIAPPMAAAAPKLTPPEVPKDDQLMVPRDDQLLPLPPKVNEIPLNSNPKGSNNHSTDDTSDHLSMPRRWDCIPSNGPSLEILILKASFMVLVVLLLFLMIA